MLFQKLELQSITDAMIEPFNIQQLRILLRLTAENGTGKKAVLLKRFANKRASDPLKVIDFPNLIYHKRLVGKILMQVNDNTGSESSHNMSKHRSVGFAVIIRVERDIYDKEVAVVKRIAMRPTGEGGSSGVLTYVPVYPIQTTSFPKEYYCTPMYFSAPNAPRGPYLVHASGSRLHQLVFKEYNPDVDRGFKTSHTWHVPSASPSWAESRAPSPEVSMNLPRLVPSQTPSMSPSAFDNSIPFRSTSISIHSSPAHSASPGPLQLAAMEELKNRQSAQSTYRGP